MRDPSPDRPGSLTPVWPEFLRHQWWSAARIQRATAFALVAAGALPPVGLAALPGGTLLLGSPHGGIVLVAALLFAPALAGFAVALQGFDAVLARLRKQSGGEYRLIIARVLLDAVIFGYVFSLLAAMPGEPAILPCVLIGALNLTVAWLFLLNVILDPRRSAMRRWVALASDVALLSILLAAGGCLTAPLAGIYLYLAISNGDQGGPRMLAGGIGLGAAAFAGVIARTPFWQEAPLMAAGILAAIVLLPLYVGSSLHRLSKAKERAETANGAKNRLLAAFTEDLRSPLRAIARAGTEDDRTELDPNQADVLGPIRLSVRSILLQLDDLLDFIQVDDGSLTPGARSFDFYRLAHGVVASLNATAAERGVELNLHIDPALPHQLHGWAHQLRQILICLITNAIRRSANSRIRINARAVDLGSDRVTMRIAVACGLSDNHLETADQVLIAAEAGRHLGLALAERWVGLMEGRLTIDNDRRRGLSLAVELPFAIDQTDLGRPVDLAQLPVLIVSEDVQFVDELAEPLEAWRAKVRWIGAGHDALDHLEALEATPGERRPVLIVDGRDDVLLSLSWTHRAASLWALRTPPLVMFIADEPRIDSIVGLADGELDSVLSAPFTLDALRGAFHALGLEPADRPPTAAESRGELADAARTAPLPAASDTPPPKRGRRILIAASSPANRRIMSSILGREGHTVNLVETVDEARKGLEARAVDLLLLDLTGAPGSDYEAARLCRRARPSLIIVALTRDSTEEAERQAGELGLDAVVPKPIDPRRLVAVIDAAIGGEPPATPLPFRVVGRPASYPRYAGEPGSAVNE